MTPEQREELKQAAMKATPGPWIHDAEDNIIYPAHGGKMIDVCCRSTDIGRNQRDHNASFIATANPAAILSLIAQVEALTVPQWISIEDRLPPIGEEVIVYVPGGRVQVTALMRLIRWEGATDFYWDNAYPGKGNMHIGTSITHWMSMPVAPSIPAIPGTKEGA